MPKVARELGPLDVKRLTYRGALDAIAKRQKHRPPDDRPVLVNVGGVSGLHLQITPNDAKSWVLRVVIGNRRRAIGLGSLGDVPLAKAHERAREAKAAIRDGIDPIEQRRAAKAALAAKDARAKTFKQAFDDFLPIRLAKIDTERSRHRWQSTVEQYVLPKIGTIGVGDITKADILRVLRQKHTNKRNGTDGDLWTVIPETASKLRGRIEEVLAWATSNGYRTGENPARWTGNLEHDLTAPGTIITATPHPAVSLDDAPAWFAAISKHDGMSARALEFVALTAARSGEVRGMVWSEVDLDGALWTVPATRMKVTANGDHVVPLCDEAVKLLRRLHNQRPADCDYVFPAPRGGPLSDMALSMLMRDMHAAEVKQGRKGWLDSRSGKPAVVHGLRSTFSTWANDHAEFEPDMIEFALAHRVGTDVAKRYRRGSMVEKRRAMMRDWAKFLRGEKSS